MEKENMENEVKNETTTKKKKPGKKAVIITVIVVVIIIAAVVAFMIKNGSAMPEQTATAAYTEVYKQLEFTGDIAPEDTRAVYSVVNQVKVSEVCVDNGDYVHEGDVLVKLDSTAIEYDIKAKELALEQAKVDAENNLANAQTALDVGVSGDLVSRSDSIKSAQARYDAAELRYNQALSGYNNDNTSEIISAKNALRAAEVALDILDKDDFNGRSTQGTAVCNAEETLNSARASAKQAVDTAAAELASAQVELDNAKAEYSAAAGTSKKTASDLQTAANKAEGSTAVEQAELELERLKTTLENYEVKAQCDGYISNITVKVGDTSDSKQLMSILDYSSMKVTVDVDEYDIAAFKLGDPVSVYIPSRNEYYDGEVEMIATEATKKNDLSYIKVTVSFSPEDMISSGLGATVYTVPGEDATQLAVPSSFVQFDTATGDSFVTVRTESGDEKRTVVTGDSDDTNTAILEGLAEGETVVSE